MTGFPFDLHATRRELLCDPLVELFPRYLPRQDGARLRACLAERRVALQRMRHEAQHRARRGPGEVLYDRVLVLRLPPARHTPAIVRPAVNVADEHEPAVSQ